jgi:hypothetical protein
MDDDALIAIHKMRCLRQTGFRPILSIVANTASYVQMPYVQLAYEHYHLSIYVVVHHVQRVQNVSSSAATSRLASCLCFSNLLKHLYLVSNHSSDDHVSFDIP